MLKKSSEKKYEQPYSAPHTILHVGKNGTVRLQIGAIFDTINIQRIEPYVEAPSSIHGGSAICVSLAKEDNTVKIIKTVKNS